MATTAPVTVEDLARMPGSDRIELIRGRLRDEPFHSGLHGRTVVEIGAEIDTFAEAHEAGAPLMRAGFIFTRNPDSVLGPDLSFFRTERVPARWTDDWTEWLPDLVVEVIEADDHFTDVMERIDLYREARVPAIWVIDPWRSRITTWTTDGICREFGPDATLDGGEILAGFQRRVSDLFPK